jgi:uncharacterized protein YqgQ
VLQHTYDYLVMGDNLLKEKEFAYSRLTLKHAQKILKTYKPTIADPQRTDQINTMKYELGKLSEELKKEDPTMLDKALKQVERWIGLVKGWVTQHAKLGKGGV